LAGDTAPSGSGRAVLGAAAAAESAGVGGAAESLTAETAIASGYTFAEPAIELGVVVVDDVPVPQAGVRIPLSMLNRHGLVAGATGTGKTKTLQLIAEQLFAAGVPVFAADLKGRSVGDRRTGSVEREAASPYGGDRTGLAASGCPTEFHALGGQGVVVPLRASMPRPSKRSASARRS
jgi:DNA double-strand break repair helicase HerA and related ATPase